MRLATTVGWIALAVTLATPVSAYATDYMITVSALRAEVYPPAQVDPRGYTVSRGRLPPTTGHIFTRSAGACNRLLCVGI
jgi:hypothetical protein